MEISSKPAKSKKSAKAYWLKQLHTWHWMSSALCLVGLLLFTITGFTLNHAADIEGSPQSYEVTGQLPANLLPILEKSAPQGDKAVLPMPVAAWLEDAYPVRARGEAEWSDAEIYLAAPRPGGDAWLTIDRASGAIMGEISSRGSIAYLNDLKNLYVTRLLWESPEAKKVRSPGDSWISVETENAASATVDAGTIVSEQNKEYAAKKRGDTFPFAINEDNFKKLFSNLERFEEPKPKEETAVKK